MKKSIPFVAVALFFVFAVSTWDLRAQEAVEPCTRKEFKTDLMKKACTDGGTKGAQNAMKEFVKKAKEAKKAAGENLTLNCQSCHSDIKKSSGYPLKENGLKLFTDLQAFIDGKR
jgi:hypothetical protein